MKNLNLVMNELSISNKAFSKTVIAHNSLKLAFEIMQEAFKQDLNSMLNDKDVSIEEASRLAVAADDDIRELFNFTLFGRE